MNTKILLFGFLMLMSMSVVSAAPGFTNLSLNNGDGNWIQDDDINGLTYYNDKVYIVGNSGKFGYYDPGAGVSGSFIGTDTGGWVDGFLLSSVVGNDGLIYTSGYYARFGVYDPSTNVWSSLMSADTGDWVGTKNIYGLYEYNGLIYVIGSSGKFGVFDPGTGVLSDLSASDTGDWMGTKAIWALEEHNGLIYVGGSSGKFGVFDPGTGVLSDLSDSDTGDWLGTSVVYSLAAADNGLIYVGGSSGKFGVFDPGTGVLSDLSASDTGDWLGTSAVNNIKYLKSNIYLAGGSTGNYFGIYNVSSGVATNIQDPIITNVRIRSLASDGNSKLYIGGSEGLFVVYSLGDEVIPPSCIEDWQPSYSPTKCPSNGIWYVTYNDANSCGTTAAKPAEGNVSCTYIPPVYDNQTFNGKTTTDLNAINTSAVNLTIASSASAVQWVEVLDITNISIPITEAVTTAASFISVNVDAAPELDTVAEVSLSVPTTFFGACEDFALYYATGYYTTQEDIVANGEVVATGANVGGDCIDPTICTNVECDFGTLTFTAQHFDGFAIGDIPASVVNSCQNTRNTVYAGFAIIVLIGLVLAAMMLLAVFKGGNIDAMTVTITIIALGIITMIGYAIIYYVSQALC